MSDLTSWLMLPGELGKWLQLVHQIARWGDRFVCDRPEVLTRRQPATGPRWESWRVGVLVLVVGGLGGNGWQEFVKFHV